MRVPRPPASTKPVTQLSAETLSTDVAHFYSGIAQLGVHGLHAGAQLRITVGASTPHGGDGLLQLCIGLRIGLGLRAAQQAAQIVPLGGKQAGVQLPLGREPCAVAIVAKSLRYAAD